MNNELFETHLSKFLIDLAAVSNDISMQTIGHWAIIGSSSLAVHGLAQFIPRDINVAMDKPAFESYCKSTQSAPVKRISPDKCLRFEAVELINHNCRIVVVGEMAFMTPFGDWQKINVADLRAETVIKDGQRFRNILTVAGYMALTGMFNRPSDRKKLDYIAELTKKHVKCSSRSHVHSY